MPWLLNFIDVIINGLPEDLNTEVTTLEIPQNGNFAFKDMRYSIDDKIQYKIDYIFNSL